MIRPLPKHQISALLGFDRTFQDFRDLVSIYDDFSRGWCEESGHLATHSCLSTPPLQILSPFPTQDQLSASLSPSQLLAEV